MVQNEDGSGRGGAGTTERRTRGAHPAGTPGPGRAVSGHTLLLSLSVVFTTTCSGPVDPPDWAAVEPTPSATSAPAPATAPRLVAYLDASGSMAGFVSPAGDTAFSRTLRELRNVASLLSPPLEVTVRRVDRQVGPPEGEALLGQASISPAFFGGAETDLAGAIRQFATPPGARFHVLVTDGVQSTSGGSRDGECLGGSDELCVRKRLLELVGKGWGVYVLAVRSEFQGKVFSEVHRVGGPAAVVDYRTDPRHPERYRPFYVWILSPDPDALIPLAERLRERIASFSKEGAVRGLGIGLPYATGPVALEATATGPGRDAIDRKVETPTGGSPRLTLRAEIGAAREAWPVSLSLAVPLSRLAGWGGSAKEVLSLVRWTLRPLPLRPGKRPAARVRRPELAVTKQAVGPDGRVALEVAVTWPASAGTPDWSVYRLEGSLDPDAPGPAWVRDWSTDLDTTADAASRTLRLESALAGLWKNALESGPAGGPARRRLVADVLVRVGPRS